MQRYAIIHSSPGPGAGGAVIAAMSADDMPPFSSREEIDAESLEAAEEYAESRYAGRTGQTVVFALGAADATVKVDAAAAMLANSSEETH